MATQLKFSPPDGRKQGVGIGKGVQVWEPDGSANVVTNGDFASGSTGWVLGTGWSVATGVATHAAGTQADLTQSGILRVNAIYKCTFTISSRTAGNASVFFGTQERRSVAANGTYIAYGIATGTTDFSVRSNAAGAFSVDNISVVMCRAKWVPEHELVPRILQPVSGEADLTVANGFSPAKLRGGDLILVDHASTPTLYVRRGDNAGWCYWTPDAK